MKPLDGTFAQNAEKYGVAGLNIDGCRIETDEKLSCSKAAPYHGADGSQRTWNPTSTKGMEREQHALGRWPANLIHDGSDEVLEVFPETTSGKPCGVRKANHHFGCSKEEGTDLTGFGDTGSTARFFYCAKADKAERGPGNNHPTVKPLALMSYLCKLVSMPGYTGTLLDPFAGSGSTLLAGTRWFERVIGIERDEEHCETIVRRLESQGASLFGA